MHLREFSLPAPFLSLCILLLFLFNTLLLHLHLRLTPHAPLSLPPSCNFPLVYNKPPKTGSTTIQRALSHWARDTNRTFLSCSSYINKASFQLRECLHTVHDGCAVVGTHIVLDGGTKELLTQRVGAFKLMTSTRRPRSRILSAFLQEHRTEAGKLGEEMELLRLFLESFNPWSLYTYHSGVYREGACPLGEEGRHAVGELAKTFDLVVDVDLEMHSNKILEHWGLFRLGGGRANRRGAEDIKLPEELERRLRNVSCVEEELHRLLRRRMASLYETATGEECLVEARVPRTCFPENS